MLFRSRKLRRGHRTLRNEYGEITSVLQEVVSGVRLVKSFRGEPYEDARFTGASGSYTRGMVRITRLSLLSGPLTEVLGTVVAVGVLWIGAREVFGGTLDGGTLITFMVMLMRLLPPLKQLSQAPTTATQSLAAAERLFEVLDEPTETRRDRGTREITTLAEGLAFDGVGFAYEADRPVLADVTFRAPKGSVIALVGSSGAGKSTLVDLIPRFIEPTAGRIAIDGVDTREIRLPSLRALTGIVSQDTVLFNDTVRANIAYGAGDRYTDAQVEAAARASNAHEFIAALPNGYATVLGERGTRLSGGQRQRIAIARALITRPRLIVADEPVSALDVSVQAQVLNLMQDLQQQFGVTYLLISHDLAVVQHLCDEVAVLWQGQIVEQGSPAQLFSAPAHPYTRQLLDAVPRAPGFSPI